MTVPCWLKVALFGVACLFVTGSCQFMGMGGHHHHHHHGFGGGYRPNWGMMGGYPMMGYGGYGYGLGGLGLLGRYGYSSYGIGYPFLLGGLGYGYGSGMGYGGFGGGYGFNNGYYRGNQNSNWRNNNLRVDNRRMSPAANNSSSAVTARTNATQTTHS